VQTENSDVVRKGISPLKIDSNEALSSVLRILVAQSVPQSVRKVSITVPQTEAGKLMLNVARHLLNLDDYDSATEIDLQRLQMCSQLIGVVHAFSDPCPLFVW